MACLVVALLTLLAATSASAKLSFERIGSISAQGAPGGGFKDPGAQGMDINQATEMLYIANSGSRVIEVFDANSQYVTQITGAATPAGAFGPSNPVSIAIDNTSGPNAGFIYASDKAAGVVNIFSPAHVYIGQLTGTTTPAGSFGDISGLAVDETGALWVSDAQNQVINRYVPTGGPLEDSDYLSQLTDSEHFGSPGGLSFDSVDNLYVKTDGGFAKYDSAGAFQSIFNPACCFPTDVTVVNDVLYLHDHYYVGVADLDGNLLAEIPAGLSGTVAVNEDSHRVYVSIGQVYEVAVYARHVLPDPITGEATNVTDHEVDLAGQMELGGGPDVEECYFEYGTDTTYGKTEPCDQATPMSGPTDVTAHLTDLLPGTVYHYRLTGVNDEGLNGGEDQTFKTFQAPTIEGFSSNHILETSADVHAVINPQNSATTYRFEYGTTPAYGQSVPSPDGTIPAGTESETVSQHLSGLASGVTYHFRVVATNAYGTTVTDDQTFDFFPPSCPNSLIRQETGANYLPDCRAYELVSPEDANGTSFFPASGPTSGTATSPSRLAYTGDFATMPDVGDPINTAGDLYVSTRTSSGWKPVYIGLAGNEAIRVGGPWKGEEGAPDKAQIWVLTNPGMDRFLQWDNGTNLFLGEPPPPRWPSNAAQVWDVSGANLGRFPTDYGQVPNSKEIFDCENERCSGEVTASSDLVHYVFSMNDHPWVVGGLSTPPGSAYDNDTNAKTVDLISKLPNGDPIPQEPETDLAKEFIRFPAVSDNGSHIVMSTEYNAGTVYSGRHLYMSVENTLFYDISKGHKSEFAGMTPDGSIVYFTSPGQITADDHDTSVDLFMWEQATDSYTRISRGTNGTGDTDNCSPSWTAQCNVELINFKSWAGQQSGQGGNGHTDSAIADNGDFYFYSPEQFDGDRGLKNVQNLYVYRDGRVQHVATMDAGPHCAEDAYGILRCSDGPVLRLQVSPDGEHMAFMTSSRLTSYDNAGHAEMFSYEPDSRKLLCVSCRPNGQPPVSDALASQNGLFMTNDGRTFFSTKDGLVPNDSNKLSDVYEYVNGRARLITQGTGDQNVDEGGFGINIIEARPGLVGVSADGTDVYFATYDTLVGQDRNGSQLKIYNARAGGGFPFVAPAPPCTAADECHGPSSQPPPPGEIGTGAALGKGGNVTAATKKKKKKKRKAKKRCAKKKRAHRNGKACGR